MSHSPLCASRRPFSWAAAHRSGKVEARRGLLWAFFLCLLAILPAWALAIPDVSNVRASQRSDDSGLVDIYYDLSGVSGLATITVHVSPDNGVTWGVVPSSSHLSGQVGGGVGGGVDRHIVWDAGADRPDLYWPKCKVRIMATDSVLESMTIMLPAEVPLELVRLPAGSFLMGAPAWERSSTDEERPVHTVTIDYDFYMGKTEITQQQWLAVMASWPNPETWMQPSFEDGLGDNRPAYYISRSDAHDYIIQLNAWIQSSGQGPLTVRLPSEAEWEYACRAGTTTRFYFGDSLSKPDVCEDAPADWYPGNRTDYMWYCGNNGDPGYPDHGAKDVGTKLPNPWGLYDMHGNVFEFCEDDYHSNYIGAPNDGSAWRDGVPAPPVVRGGYWRNHAKYCRSALRTHAYSPANSFWNVGFRLAADP